MWQQARRKRTGDNVDAPSLVHLLSTSTLCVRDKPPGSSLLCSEHVGRDEQVEEVGRRGGRGGTEQGAQEMMWTHRPSCLCFLPLSCMSATSVDECMSSLLLSFKAAGTVGDTNGGRGECKGSGGG